jgi:hypothetical protein
MDSIQNEIQKGRVKQTPLGRPLLRNLFTLVSRGNNRYSSHRIRLTRAA